MKYFVAFIAVIAISVQAWSEPRLPIDSGQHTFQHRFAEHADSTRFSANDSAKPKPLRVVGSIQALGRS
jgi:hypothetical protein